MSATTIKKAARDLRPGDVLVFNEFRSVVTRMGGATNGHVAVSSVLLGFDQPVRMDCLAPDAQFMAELPAGLTPVQAKADELLGYARAYLDCALNDRLPVMTTREGESLRALLAELDPPKPPTLEEAIDALRYLEQQASISANKSLPESNNALLKARSLLKRVPN